MCIPVQLSKVYCVKLAGRKNMVTDLQAAGPIQLQYINLFQECQKSIDQSICQRKVILNIYSMIH